ncbi:hypothetical protein D7V97_15800 [Corallococcus sp. CA053C]|uniref:hypothetical protein n=1 Tax=Corallococcus sp. CA053C TaxID=2316732 RepID=UPI000EA08713|nr:hypothetical protein [Corallococcus sp. CA053C]RKH09667.1 hypothetical protein D7V97_15800 [Corallococcus sp. CA053C]
MKKKWVIGVVLGCVGLLAVAVVGLVAVGAQADRDMEGSGLSSMQDAQAQARRLAELNTRYPFRPPPAGQLLKLDEARLEAYLTAREATMPAFHTLETESTAFFKQYGNDLGSKNPSVVLKAAGASMRMIAKARAALATNLEASRMSPLEFQGLTRVVYPSAVAAPKAPTLVSQPSDPENIALLEKQLAALTPQLEDPKLSEEQRLQLEQRRAGLRKYITTLELTGGKAVRDANAALLAKHQARIAKAANTGFDELLVYEKAADSVRPAAP